MSGWRYAHIGTEGQAFDLNGLNPWAYEWRSLEENVTLPHPDYPSQFHAYRVWEINAANKVLRFAATDVSNCVWAFYLPSPS
ncbi:hypothetical protein IZ6_21590 [Terrihabitans soli]|uniref:Uncharacterized protein n=1 Tax=Terrihabitans soli TaxID=708113 RepID=A0A6S6QLY1_9HYPH|nr:hypothetical protein [Terrihabitans soli]BCJ91424.1 hypothetical protein IZ6_21590 [Terrihabitans soli]